MIVIPITRRPNDYQVINEFLKPHGLSIGYHHDIIAYGDCIAFINDGETYLEEYDVRKNELRQRSLRDTFTDEEVKEIWGATRNSDVSDNALGTQIIIFLLRSMSKEVDGDVIFQGLRLHFGCESMHKIILNKCTCGLIFEARQEAFEEVKGLFPKQSLDEFMNSTSGFMYTYHAIMFKDRLGLRSHDKLDVTDVAD